MLKGRIFEVRVYDQALSSEQITATFSGQPVVSDADVLAELTPDQRQRIVELRERVAEREKSLQRSTEPPGPHDPLARVAHAIFNLKEFIYVR